MKSFESLGELVTAEGTLLISLVPILLHDLYAVRGVAPTADQGFTEGRFIARVLA